MRTEQLSLMADKGNRLALPVGESFKIVGSVKPARGSRRREDSDTTGLTKHTSRTSLSPTQNQNSSFVTETSFTRAPLRSRISLFAAVQHISHKEHLIEVSVEVQEALLLEDLLCVLAGIEGTYITYDLENHSEGDGYPSRPRYVLSPTLDSSLRDFVERVLPIAIYYRSISSFVETRSHLNYGLVNHALSAAIRDMLKDYKTLLAQLEHAFNVSPHFTLKKLWYYIHPTLHTLSLIHQLILELENIDEIPPENLSGSDVSSIFEEEEGPAQALGLGGAGFKALLSTIHNEGVGALSDIPVIGGEVLAVIYERRQRMSGDPTARILYGTLLRAAGAPYLAMLKMWTTTGQLEDCYGEFFVKENKSVNRDSLAADDMYEHWDQKYLLRDGPARSIAPNTHLAGHSQRRPGSGRLSGGACVPQMLNKWKHMILLTGKYVNIVQECGIEVRRDQSPPDDSLWMDDEKLYGFVDEAYIFANRALLHLLLDDQQLISRLRALKHYFLLSESTYLTYFLELSQSELRKSSQVASVVRLQSLLDLAVASDLATLDDSNGAFDGGLRVKMAGSGLYEWLLKISNVTGISDAETLGGASITGNQEKPRGKEMGEKEKKTLSAIDALTVDCIVSFPLSLVISRRAILRYQLLFRFLLHLKHLERSLSAMWVEQNTTLWRQAVPYLPELEKWRLRVSLLRVRMLAFLQQLLAFATFDMIESNWQILEMKLKNATTVDQVLAYHADFLDTCLKGCMLTSSKLLQTHSRLMVTCSTFARYGSALSRDVVKALAAPEDDQSMTERWEFLGKFETHFDHWFKIHLNYLQLDALSENISLLPLVTRLQNIQLVRDNS